MPPPKSSDILPIIAQHFPKGAHAIRRFETGLAHFVYDVALKSGERVFIRLANPDHAAELAGGVFWHARLLALEVPLPVLIAHDLDAPWPYMILERLPGADLGQVYGQLSGDQRRVLAYQIAGIQDQVAQLEPADSYGWLTSYDSGFNVESWLQAATWKLTQARPRLESSGIRAEHVDRVLSALTPFEPYLREVPPTPFLDDTTTKNVLVHNGQLSGIVDTDYVCFGDRLYVLALTQMALLSTKDDLDYIDHWAEAWGLNEFQRQVVNVYTAIHCIQFMVELGHATNTPPTVPFDAAQLTHLESILDSMLQHN